MNNLIGKKVVVFSDSSNGERQDIGILVGIEGIWVSIKKSEAETMHFCVYNIRLVKAFDA